MSAEQKREIAKEIEPKRLLELYDMYTENFNPLDADTCETREIIKEEIWKRMKGETP